MKQQHKKLADALEAELTRITARAEGLPKTGVPYAFLCGRYFVYGRVARDLAGRRDYQELANLCQERIAMGPYLGVPGWLHMEYQQFPLPYHVRNRAEHAAYPEILALLKEYVGIEPRLPERCDCEKCRNTVHGKSLFCEKVPA